jgi:hypothetical protein
MNGFLIGGYAAAMRSLSPDGVNARLLRSGE